MEKEHRIPEEATRPQPKRTSLRRAAMMAAGLALGGETAAAEPPIGSSETRATTEASQAAPDKAKEATERLRARLESFTFITGLHHEKGIAVSEGTRPDNMYKNAFTSEFIDWLLKFHMESGESAAEELLRCDGASEKFMVALIPAELRFRIDNPGASTRVSTKMRRQDAETYIQFLKDTEIEREQ